MTPEAHQAIAKDIIKAHDEISRICQDPEHNFRMSIPANMERDSDLIITTALNHTATLLAALDAANLEIAELKAAIDVQRVVGKRAEEENVHLRWKLGEIIR